MAVGATIGKDQMDNILSSLAVGLRDAMTNIAQLNLSVNGGAAGLAYLQNIGYSNAPNPLNPGGVSDAALALATIAYLNTVAGCYFGTVQQGGTGGTGAAIFNFHQQLSAFWAGRVVT